MATWDTTDRSVTLREGKAAAATKGSPAARLPSGRKDRQAVRARDGNWTGSGLPCFPNTTRSAPGGLAAGEIATRYVGFDAAPAAATKVDRTSTVIGKGQYGPVAESLSGKIESEWLCESAFVALLLGSRGPSAVGGFVMAVVVDPIEAMIVAGSKTHVFQECKEVRLPLNADANSSASVSGEVLKVLVSAALDHRAPHVVLRNSVQSVDSVHAITISHDCATGNQ